MHSHTGYIAVKSYLQTENLSTSESSLTKKQQMLYGMAVEVSDVI